MSGPRIIYTSERATLYLGDAREVLAAMDRESVDLLVTDPPYGIGYHSGWRKNTYPEMSGDDDMLGILGVLADAVRVLRHRRHAYVFGLQPEALAGIGLGGTIPLVWDKGLLGMGDLTAPWGSSHEPVAFGVKPASKGERGNRGALAARLRQGSVLRVPRLTNAHKRHPTEKPVMLMRRLIESSSAPGDSVLDPFAGSGSTLVAAILEGRSAVGVEIDARYADVAVERVRRAETHVSKEPGL